MQTRKLGNSSLNVPVIMLGGNVFGWTLDEKASFRILDTALDLGLNFIDTADIYSYWGPGNSGGESETILGKWFVRTGKRSHVILATKLGKPMGEGKKGLSGRYMKQAVEDSLKRLQTDFIDLYQSHMDDPETPLEETMEAFTQLVKEGKVRVIGASNYSGRRLRESLDLSRKYQLESYQSIQPHYNLVERASYEKEISSVVKESGIGVIPYYSLASGFLSGKYRTLDDTRGKARGQGAAKYITPDGLAVLEVLDEIAEEYNSNPARVSLAWLIAQPGITAPIASATTESQLQDLVEATKLNLQPGSIEKLTSVSARF